MVNEELQFGSKDGELLMRATPKGVVAESLSTKDPIEYPKNEILGDNPLYLINGKEYRKDQLPKETEVNTDGEITMLDKEDGLAKYGEKGSDGVIEISGNAKFSAPKEEEPEKVHPTEGLPKEFRIKIDKNTTDAELESMKAELKREHGINLNYSVNRNSGKEITAIAISYTDDGGNTGSYNISGDEPIEEFFFYMDSDGDRGFWSEAHQKRMEERLARRKVEMEERMVEREARIKERKQEMEERRVEMEERNGNLARRLKEQKEVRRAEMKERREEMKEREKELARRYKSVARASSRSGSGSNTFVYSDDNEFVRKNSIVITKDTSDEKLEEIKKELAAKGITFTYKKLRRNSRGEITRIKVEANNGKGGKSQISHKSR